MVTTTTSCLTQAPPKLEHPIETVECDHVACFDQKGALALGQYLSAMRRWSESAWERCKQDELPAADPTH